MHTLIIRWNSGRVEKKAFQSYNDAKKEYVKYKELPAQVEIVEGRG